MCALDRQMITSSPPNRRTELHSCTKFLHRDIREKITNTYIPRVNYFIKSLTPTYEECADISGQLKPPLFMRVC